MFSCNASIVTVFCWLGVSWNKSFYAKSLSLNHGTIQNSHITNKDCLHNTILKKKKGQGKGRSYTLKQCCSTLFTLRNAL